jgi:hyperosmotically inducible periplasmic protein
MSVIKTIRTPILHACWSFLLVAVATLIVTGCDRNDNRTAGEKVDSAIAKTERAADEAAAKTGEAAKEARAKVESSDAGSRIANTAKDAGSALANAADDASITTAVTAGLAKDPDLSAIRIDVDTDAGKVTLRGPAPTPAAKDRAEQIAKGVKGVGSVDNQLEVKAM